MDAYTEQLLNIYQSWRVWDGDLISKTATKQLWNDGLIHRRNGWSWISKAGFESLKVWGLIDDPVPNLTAHWIAERQMIEASFELWPFAYIGEIRSFLGLPVVIIAKDTERGSWIAQRISN